MNKSVIGIVDNRQQAEVIVKDLQAAGFGLPDVSVLYPHERGETGTGSERGGFGLQNSTKAPEGATAGVSAGGVIGGTIGLLAGLGAIAIPGLGPFIAAGPLLGALSGAAAGAAAGGVTGALIGLGIPEIEARRYEQSLAGGANVLVAVHVDTADAVRDATEVLKRDGARDVSTARETSGGHRAS